MPTSFCWRDHDASDRVASGWPEPVRTEVQRFDGGTALVLQWNVAGRPRAVAARTLASGRTDILGLSLIGTKRETPPRLLHRWPALPSVDELTLGIRLAMEAIDRET